MRVTRRDLLKTTLAAAVVSRFQNAFALSDIVQHLSSLGLIPILQTATDETSAQFRVLRSGPQRLSYQACDSAGRAISGLRIVDQYTHPAWLGFTVDHLKCEGLKTSESYTLKAINSDTGASIDERTFSTLNLLGSARLAVISCTCDDFTTEQVAMWKAVADENPDAVFLIGDAAYLDGRGGNTERAIFKRHLEVRQALDLFKWKNLKPVYSVWDDHDFGLNDSGGEFPLKNATRQMFEAMFGSSENTTLVHGPSLSQEIKFGPHRIYLMDNRFYRTKNVSNGTHWGQEQEDWLFDRLSRDTSPVLLMNGSQYFGGYSGYESFEGEHPEEFSRVQNRLSLANAPVVFVSGDRHFSELMNVEEKILGYKTLELTSSSLHSYAPKQIPSDINPRRFAATKDFNFLMLESSNEAGALNLKVRCVGAGNSLLFSHQQLISKA